MRSTLRRVIAPGKKRIDILSGLIASELIRSMKIRQAVPFEERVVEMALNLANRDRLGDERDAQKISKWFSQQSAHVHFGSSGVPARKLWRARRISLSPESFAFERRKLRGWLRRVVEKRPPRYLHALRRGEGARIHLNEVLRRLVAYPTLDLNGRLSYRAAWPSVEHFAAFAYALLTDPTRPWGERLRLCIQCRWNFFLLGPRGRRGRRCPFCAEERNDYMARTYYTRRRKKDAKR